VRALHLFAKTVLTIHLFFAGAFAQGSLVEIITPKEKHLQSEFTLNVVLKIDKKKLDTVEIGVFPDMKRVDMSGSKSTVCTNVSLSMGENKILVHAYKNGVLIGEESRSVYVSSELYHQFKYPPKEYKKNYFHTDENEKLCSKCHDMSINEVEGIAFVDVTKSNCYGCHKSMNKEKYAHAPSANWLCTGCHKEGEKNISKYLTKKPVNNSCFECHEENKELWRAAKYMHEPLDNGDCNRCHNPHSSPYGMFIRKEVNEICLGCHKEHISRIQKSDTGCTMLEESQKCTSCHTPHASNRAFFLKKALKEMSR